MVYITIIEVVLIFLLSVLSAASVIFLCVFFQERLEGWKEKRWQQKMKKERAEYRKKQEIKKRERELRKKEMSTHPLFYWKQTCKPTLRIKE